MQPPPLPDTEKNKKDRVALKLLYLSQPDIRPVLKERAATDFVWWANHFAFAHDEHDDPKRRIKPIVLWPIQERISEEVIENVFRCAHGGIEEEWGAYGDKARQMAWTFLMLLLIQWFWQFHNISTVITSKTDEDVDRKADMDTPFEKLRFQIGTQYSMAPWMFPETFNIEDKEYYKKKLIAIPMGAKIVGAGARGPELRQGRGLIWFGDEFPHTENDTELWDAACGTVKVRIVGGTPNREKGRDCKAYRLRFNKDAENVRVFTMPWYEHPERGQGLYKRSDGTWSSPWMDSQIAKKSRQTIATEFLMDWDAAMGKTPLYAFREECCWIGLQPDEQGGPLMFSWDPGKHFGVKMLQKDYYGRLRDLFELYMRPEDVVDGKSLLDAVAERVKSVIKHRYSHFETKQGGPGILHVGDPYGSRTQLAMQTKSEFELLSANHSIRVQSAYMYSIAAKERKTKRHNILNDLFGRDCVESNGNITPYYLIDPRACPLTYEAIKVDYRWHVDSHGVETDEIAKSHPANEMIDNAGMVAIKLFDKEKRSGSESSRESRRPRAASGKMQWRRSGGARYA